jgi:hypothetical protein
MSIDERIEEIMKDESVLMLSGGARMALRKQLRNTLLETARDQRHACAEVLQETNPHVMWSIDTQRQAVMNAKIK